MIDQKANATTTLEDGRAAPKDPPRSNLVPVLVTLVGTLSGLLGGGITAYLTSRTEKQKSSDQISIEHGKSLTQLQIEQEQALAQVALQRSQSEAQLRIEKMKAEGDLNLEKERQDASAKLSRQEFETKLIMQAVQGVAPDVATKNLQYFLQAGFISDPDGKISHLSVAAPPSIPSPNATSIPLGHPQACTELTGQDFKGAATPLTATDLNQVAASLGAEPAALQAILDVSTTGHGFAGGRPYMIYERSTFHRLTQGKFDETNPDVSSADPIVHGGSDAQYRSLKEAMALDCGAALASSTWYLSMLTADSYKSAGFKTVDDFIRTQMESERAQLETLASFMTNTGLTQALRDKDWPKLARMFEGSGQRQTLFARKYAEAYAKRHGS